jgi:DNA replication protein DnaC
MSNSNCDCGGQRVPLTLNGNISWPGFFCPSCESKYTLNGDPKRGAEWAYEPIGIPVEYTKTVVEKIPCNNMKKVATDWEGWKDGRSILLHGTTRLGKTRAAWEIARRHWKSKFKKQLFFTMRGFERMIDEGFHRGDHSKRLDEIIKCPFLYIDDLGKEKMTQRIACDLFAVVDERTINHRPTVITTNFTSSGLLGRFDDQELGAALIGRFRDYFDIVGAKEEKTS